MSETPPALDTEYFDGWYASMASSRTVDEISQRHLGAALVGVDFSAEALRQARQLAKRLCTVAEFRVGDLAATGLESGSADDVLCVDAIQFAVQPHGAYGELRRLSTAAATAAPARRGSWRRQPGRR